MEKTMDKIVQVAKARGFVYPGSEIYGGLAIERIAVLQQGNWINTEMADVNPEVADNLGIIPIPLGDVVSGKLAVGVPCCYNVYSGASDAEKAGTDIIL